MHPVLFYITDNFFLGTYGMMIAIGLLLSLALAAWRGRRRGYRPEDIFDLAFVTVISGFLCARLLYIVVEWQEFLRDPMAIVLSRTGFVFQGGLVGGTLGGILFLRRRKLAILPIGDLAVPSLALAHALGRVGCHFAGCCFGGVCQSPLGIHLPPIYGRDHELFFNAYAAQLNAGVIAPDATHSLAVWPVQLMESAGLLAIVGALLFFASQPRRPGRTLALYLVLYGILRFGLEFLRGDVARGSWLGGIVSTGQFFAILQVLAALGILWWSRDKSPSPHSHPSLAPPTPATDDPDGDEALTPGARRRAARRRQAKTT